jgi:histidinol-phosphate aminotransferase
MKPTYADLARPHLVNQPVYEPGKPTELVAAEHGLDPATVIKLASNENPLGPSPKARDAALKAVSEAHLYPENGALFLRRKLAALWNLEADHFFVGRGSSEVIDTLAAAFTGPGTEVVFGAQAFISYKLAAMLQGAVPVGVPMKNFGHDLRAMRAAVTPRTRLVFVPSPNNPTGVEEPAGDLVDFAASLPDHVVFCYDGAYVEYLANPPDFTPLLKQGRKVVVARTFSKIHGLAGLRVGYACGHPELITLMHKARAPFNVTSVALAAAEAALGDEDFTRRSVACNAAGRTQLTEGLRGAGLEFVPGAGNFLMTRVGNGTGVFNALQKRGVIVRPLAGYGLPEWIRVTIGLEHQNALFLEELNAVRGVC